MTKKLFMLSLLLAIVMTAFAGCNDDSEKDLNIYSVASYDNESKFAPSENSNSEEISEEPLTGEFVVKDKKYTFEGNDLVIVSVENKTNKNYSVTVTGTYLDADGKALKTETQTSDQYSAGFSQYFLFEPKMKFDKFTYTFETKEASGPFCAKDTGVKYNGIQHERLPIDEEMAKNNFTKYPTILASYSIQYTGKTPVNIWVKWLLINENDEILFAFDRQCRFYIDAKYTDGETHYTLHQTKDETWQHPEEWENMQAIPVYIGYTTDMSHYWPWQYPSW